jgi:ubiquinone/menaquinone biosynthesis C-methylase UbiE
MPDLVQSRLAARLQHMVSKRREEVGLYGEIADQLSLPDHGRVLDVGTGSGLQLRVVHQQRPDLKLFGLDASAASIAVAQRNLKGIEVDLRVGGIEQAPYDDGTFDVVTCNASMSYWQNPIRCFNEIERILKPGGTAVLFEPQRDIDMDEVLATIRANLADQSPLRRFLAVSLNEFGLRWGRVLGLRLRSVEELSELAHASAFGHNVSIERVTLQNLPIFARITLRKPAAPPVE